MSHQPEFEYTGPSPERTPNDICIVSCGIGPQYQEGLYSTRLHCEVNVPEAWRGLPGAPGPAQQARDHLGTSGSHAPRSGVWKRIRKTPDALQFELFRPVQPGSSVQGRDSGIQHKGEAIVRSEKDIRQVVEDLKWARVYYGGSGASTVMLTAEITALNWALGEPDIVGNGSYEDLREKRAKIERAATN